MNLWIKINKLIEKNKICDIINHILKTDLSKKRVLRTLSFSIHLHKIFYKKFQKILLYIYDILLKIC